MSKTIIAIVIIMIIAVMGYWIYQSTITPEEEVVSEGSKDCVNDEDCIVFGKTGDCNCGCYNKNNLPSGTGGECFCAAPNSCKCVNSKCEGVFEEEVTAEEKEIPEEQTEEQVEKQTVSPEEEDEEMPEEEKEEPTPILAQITFLDDLIADPDWNSNGNQIVFCIKGGESPTLHLINVDGSGFKEIGPGFDPSWSPVEIK